MEKPENGSRNSQAVRTNNNYKIAGSAQRKPNQDPKKSAFALKEEESVYKSLLKNGKASKSKLERENNNQISSLKSAKKSEQTK